MHLRAKGYWGARLQLRLEVYMGCLAEMSENPALIPAASISVSHLVLSVSNCEWLLTLSRILLLKAQKCSTCSYAALLFFVSLEFWKSRSLYLFLRFFEST